MEIANLLAKATDTMHVSRSFGPASEHGGVTIVPVAWVAGGGGGGGGTGAAGATTPDDPEGQGAPWVTGSGGGGFGGVSWPLGVYVIQDGQVRWVPALDVTRLAIAALGAVKLVVKLRAARRREHG